MKSFLALVQSVMGGDVGTGKKRKTGQNGLKMKFGPSVFPNREKSVIQEEDQGRGSLTKGLT